MIVTLKNGFNSLTFNFIIREKIMSDVQHYLL